MFDQIVDTNQTDPNLFASLVVKGEYSELGYVRKFGRNPVIDSGTDEDIWDGGGTYTWPAAAAATTIVSASTDDDTGGTGALTVRVIGLDADYIQISEDVIMDGTGAVTLTNQFLRVFRAYVLTAGSGGENAGNIQVKHGATVLAQITATFNQTLMAIYTVPANQTGYGYKVYASLNKGSGAGSSGNIMFWVREVGGVFRLRFIIGLQTAGNSQVTQEFKFPVSLAEKTDIYLSASVSANSTDVSAGFDILLASPTA